MSARNPRSYAAYRAKLYPKAARTSAIAARRMKTMKVIVPGVTRVGGAYRRSIPRKSEETHYTDTTFSFSPPLNGAGAFPTMTPISPTPGAPVNPSGQTLCLISQGTGKNQRIGNKLHMYQVRLHGDLQIANTDNSDLVRIIMYRDKQTNGSIPLLSDILEQANASAAAGYSAHSFANMDNVERFDILKDKKYKINEGAGIVGAFSNIIIPIKMSKKINCRIDYSSTTGAITELRSDSIGILAVSINDQTTFEGTCRVYWKE